MPTAIATTFPDDCLPPEGFYESRETLSRLIRGLLLEVMLS